MHLLHLGVQVKFNVIANNGQWPDGVPPVMGAHLMASGTVAPISTSKGEAHSNVIAIGASCRAESVHCNNLVSHVEVK